MLAITKKQKGGEKIYDVKGEFNPKKWIKNWIRDIENVFDEAEWPFW